jgi:hypothetical protein
VSDAFGGYDAVNVIRDVGVVDLELLRAVARVEPSTATGDVLDSIVVALELLEKAIKCNRQILLVTDARSEIKDMEMVDAIVDQFKVLECSLKIV